MSSRKVRKQSDHAKLRLSQRTDITDEQVFRSASKKGKNPMDFFYDGKYVQSDNLIKYDNALYKYLSTLSIHKRVKLYKGNVYIFHNTSNGCITMYPLLEEYMEEYNEWLNYFKEVGIR